MGHSAHHRILRFRPHRADTSMVVMLVALVIGLVPIRAFGGRISRLADLRLRGHVFVLAAVFTQVVLTTTSIVSSSVSPIVHAATYVAIVPFFWMNRRLPGTWIIAIGAVLNTAAIFANGGVMPASDGAYRVAGIALSGRFANSAPVSSPNLSVLGDIFAIPESWPFATVFSIGDVVIVVGALFLTYRTCGARWPVTRPRKSRSAQDPARERDRTGVVLDGAREHDPHRVADPDRRGVDLIEPTIR